MFFYEDFKGGVKMNLTSLSAGTGPAAGILIGGIMILAGISIGWLVLAGGFILSLVWSRAFG